MQPAAEHIDGAAVGKIGGIADELIVRRYCEVPRHSEGVISLEYLLAGIAWQCAVANEQAPAACCQETAECRRNFVKGSGNADRVGGPAPVATLDAETA